MPPLPKLIELKMDINEYLGELFYKKIRCVPLNFRFKKGTSKKQIILPSLEYGIEVGQEIIVASGKFVKMKKIAP